MLRADLGKVMQKILLVLGVRRVIRQEALESPALASDLSSRRLFAFDKNVWIDDSSAPWVVWTLLTTFKCIAAQVWWRLVPEEWIPLVSIMAPHKQEHSAGRSHFSPSFLWFTHSNTIHFRILHFLAPLNWDRCHLAAPPLRPLGLIDWVRGIGMRQGWLRMTVRARGSQEWLFAWSSDGPLWSWVVDTPWWGRCPSSVPGRQLWPELVREMPKTGGTDSYKIALYRE